MESSTKLINTSINHRGFALLGRTSATFAVILLLLYGSSFWFDYNACHFGILATLASIIVTDRLLRGLESDLSCRLFSPLLKGRPPVVYRNWLKVEQDAFKFGLFKLRFDAISDVSLNALGTLIFKTEALSGPLPKNTYYPAAIILKLPFSALSLNGQKDFISLFKKKCPQASLGKSLQVLQSKPILKSPSVIQSLTLLIFFAILLDVGQATFDYIELLKRYYLSQKYCQENNHQRGKEEFDFAESLRTQPAQFSIILPKLLNESSAAAGLFEARSKALWSLDRLPESLDSQIKAATISPSSFKINLRLARLYANLGRSNESQQTIADLTKLHKHSLLPHLYTARLQLNENKLVSAKNGLQEYLTFLSSDYFSQEPVWPSAGESTLHELFTREDLKFLLEEKQFQ